MANDNEPDIAQMWRQQPQRRDAMRMEEIRSKAREFDAKVRRWGLVGAVTVGLLLVKNVWEIWADTDALERAGDLLMFLGLLYVVYRFSRHAGTHLRPSTLGVTNCVEYYRAQLMRQRELSRDSWNFILPFVPGIGLILVARAFQGRPASQVTALIVGALVMFGGVLWVMARGARQLDREIAALDE